jgi:hypothetical protein
VRRHATSRRFARSLAPLALLLPLALPLHAALAADPAQSSSTRSPPRGVQSRPRAASRARPRGRRHAQRGSVRRRCSRSCRPHRRHALRAAHVYYSLGALPPGRELVSRSRTRPASSRWSRASCASARRRDQAIELARYGVELRPEVEYEWTVTLVSDPAKRSADVITAGWVERIAPPAGLDVSDPAALAAQGLWYDAFAKAPEALREALLRDAGLAPAAPR